MGVPMPSGSTDTRRIQLGNLFERALDFTADDVPGVSFDPKPAPAVEVAKDFISEVLAKGPLPAARLRQLAQERGIKFGSLYRAKHRLGVLTKSDQWSLPS